MIIPARFNGPPTSGNGGYTAGTMATEYAAHHGQPDGLEVTLRYPPPLDTRFEVRTEAAPVLDGMAVPIMRAFHGDTLIAEATMNAVADDEVVAGVSASEAAERSATYLGFNAHPFPTCYVCGPQRDDGLRIFPGRVGDGRTAAPFVVPADVSTEVMWAALDCPGGWAVHQELRAYVLGRMAARVDALPAPGETCVAMGELLGEDGRKAHVRTSVYSAAGELLATARATWIALPPS
jgi:hypothetical protein